MPKIPEYLPEEAAAEPQGGTSPVLEAVTQLGQGIEHFGRGVTEVADVVQSRMSMMESADAQSQAAETKSEYFDRVRDETNRGVLDQNKLFDDYDEWQNKASEQFSTPRGKAEFEKAAGRTRASLIRWAAQGSAQIAGANALAEHNNTVNSLTNLTAQDPHSFASNMADLDHLYESYKNDPNLGKNPIALQKMKQGEQAQLASAAVKGQMDLDFNTIVQDMTSSGGRVDPTNPRYTLAEGMLKSGIYDSYLNADQKEALQKNIRQNFSNAQTEGTRVLKVQKDQFQGEIDDKFAKAYPAILAGQYSVKQAMQDFQGDPKAMEHAVNLIREQNNPSVVENSPGFNHIVERMISDSTDKNHISTPEEVRDAMKQAGVPPKYYTTLVSKLSKGPDAEAENAQEKNLIAFAKRRLESVEVGGMEMVGQKNPYSGVQLQKFILAIDAAKKQAVAEGKPANSVIDVNNPKSMWGRVEQFHLPPEDVLKQLSNTASSEQLKTKPTQTEEPAQRETITMYDKDGNSKKVWKDMVGVAKKRGWSER